MPPEEQEQLKINVARSITITPKLIVWLIGTVIGGFASVEATILTAWFRQDGRITSVEKDTRDLKETQSEMKNTQTVMRADVNILIQHAAVVDTKLDNLKPIRYDIAKQ